MIRTILFFVVMYFLVKVISRMFLQSNTRNRRSNKARFFYQAFKNMSEQQKRQQQQQKQRQNQNRSQNGSPDFEEIEEAEFEDITEEEIKSSKSAD